MGIVTQRSHCNLIEVRYAEPVAVSTVRAFDNNPNQHPCVNKLSKLRLCDHKSCFRRELACPALPCVRSRTPRPCHLETCARFCHAVKQLQRSFSAKPSPHKPRGCLTCSVTARDEISASTPCFSATTIASPPSRCAVFPGPVKCFGRTNPSRTESCRHPTKLRTSSGIEVAPKLSSNLKFLSDGSAGRDPRHALFG